MISSFSFISVGWVFGANRAEKKTDCFYYCWLYQESFTGNGQYKDPHTQIFIYIYTYVCVLTLRIVLEKLPWVAYTHPSVFFHFLFCHARNTPIAMGDEMVFCIRYDVHVVGDGRNEARYRRSRQLQMVFYWFSPCAWRKNKTWWGFDRRISAFALRVHTYKYFT